MRILTLPGVFRPRSDTWMLAGVLHEDEEIPGSSVLDVCTGSGAIAIAAARAGAAEVTATDVSRRAVLAARLNAALNRVPLHVVRGDLLASVGGRSFDLIVSNPPYLPSDSEHLPRSGAERAWDAGRNGRVVLDRILTTAPALLSPGGRLMLVHSSVCGEARTVELLRDAGLEAEVVQRRRGPLGPLLAARARLLEERGLIEPGAREEEVLVIQGRRV